MKKQRYDYKLVWFFGLFILGISAISIYFTRLS